METFCFSSKIELPARCQHIARFIQSVFRCRSADPVGLYPVDYDSK